MATNRLIQAKPYNYRKQAPTAKEKVEALEKDFCKWLTKNRTLSYQKKCAEILSTFSHQNISPAEVAALAAHMLVRMDMARLVIERERQFELLIATGYKSAQSRKRNAMKPRPGGRNQHLKAIKAILRGEKKEGRTFKEFMRNVVDGSYIGLEIKKLPGEKYTVLADAFEIPIQASYTTIQGWFTNSRKKNCN